MPCYTKYSKTNWQLLGVQNVAWAIPWLSIREITAMGEIHSINASQSQDKTNLQRSCNLTIPHLKPKYA